MGKNRITYLWALLGSLVFYIAYREWLSWLLLVAVLGLPWLSLLVSLPLIASFRARVNGPGTIPMGTDAMVTLQGTGWLLVPAFSGRLRLRRPLTGEQWRYKNGGPVPSNHCGGILAAPEKLYVCDLLGLFRFPVKAPAPCRIIVRPKPLAIPQLPELERYLARAWKPKPGGGYAENHEMREYRPGDSLNQIHWKLTAKTGKLTLREPMEPLRGRVLLTVDICGTAEELDRKFGRLLWLGEHLLEKGLSFDVMALTGEGIMTLSIINKQTLEEALDQLLCASPAASGSVLDGTLSASWHRHVGGEPDEA